MGLERRPGWYPDDSHLPEFRFWTGEAWTRMRSSLPLWGPIGGDRPVPWWGTASRVTAAPPRFRTPILVGAVAALVLLFGGVLFVATRSGDDTRTPDEVAQDAGGQRSSDQGGAGASGDTDGGTDGTGAPTGGDGSATGPEPSVLGTAVDRDDPARPGTATTTPAGSAPGSPPASSGGGAGGGSGGSGGGGVARCSTDAATLASIMNSQPEVRLVTGAVELNDIRCTGVYASGRAADGTIAVFEQRGTVWELVALGSDRPCNELALPADVVAALAC